MQFRSSPGRPMIEERERRQGKRRVRPSGERRAPSAEHRAPARLASHPVAESSLGRHAKAIIGAIGSALCSAAGAAPGRIIAMQINPQPAAAGQRCPSLLFDSRGMAFMSLMEK